MAWEPPKRTNDCWEGSPSSFIRCSKWVVPKPRLTTTSYNGNFPVDRAPWNNLISNPIFKRSDKSDGDIKAVPQKGPKCVHTHKRSSASGRTDCVTRSDREMSSQLFKLAILTKVNF